MEIFRGIAELSRPFRRPVLTIGNFDGVHLGHRAILDLVIGRARALGGESILYTFEPHPRRVLHPDSGLRLLETFDQKVETLAALGLDAVIAEPFDQVFAKVTPERFLEHHLHERIAPVEVYVGYDFHFGRDREGSMRLLTERGPHLGFSVTVVPEVSVKGRDVNSTRIRELLAAGEVEEAAILLGRPFQARGRIVAGDRRGRTIGFPTANLDPETEILPAPGVYYGRLRRLAPEFASEGAGLPVVTNVGYRPTFRDGRSLVAEAHVLDFTGDLYGQPVDLSFEGRLRGERRFESVDALREQIARDVALAREHLA
ncbi:MAG: bifunctional riboflavin kinase/FAD synthetase [Spirochaetaceae bacterium]|nr:bifunctional riboflavin kinase/FAD synthetase [Myxococcales bacterium]MCB9722915.1 bifunctional riboflavin kinase/FAD synthetase [Spirochaetaceae bacterium]